MLKGEIMKRVALSVMLALSTITLPVYGQTIEQIMDGTITLQQTDGFIGSLSGGQTHHVIGPRLNFRVPTRTINAVSFTPPSLETGCNGTNFNLGNFSIISLDEAIAVLRQIAAQSLNYAFGQALQAMCQPCWAGLNDLKKQLNAFNMNAKNTCAFAKAFVDDFDIDGKIESLTDEVCTSTESAIGTDSSICKASTGVSNAYDSVVDTIEGWNITMTASGGDIDGDFKVGNVMYEMYDRIDPDNRRFEDMTVYRMLFGVPNGDPFLPWQIAASFYGTSGVMTNEENKAISYAGSVIPSIASLVFYKTNREVAESDNLTYYSCTNTPDATDPAPQCVSVNPLPVTQNVGTCTGTAVFAQDATAKPNETFVEYLRCEIEDLLEDFSTGDIFATSVTNSAVRKHILSLFNKRQQRALIFATRQEFTDIKPQISGWLANYVAAALLFDVFNEFHQNHLNMSQIARKKITGMDEELKQFDDAVAAFHVELLSLRDQKDEAYRWLNEVDQWNALAAKYEKDMSDELASLMSGR